MREPPFDIIYQDPAWRYTHERSVADGGYTYDTVDLDYMAKLDMASIANPEGCLMLCWVTAPKLAEQLRVIEQGWGFQYVTIAFTYVKTNPNAVISIRGQPAPEVHIKGSFHSGIGRWTNSNVELCVLARRGKNIHPRMDKSVKQIVLAPRGRRHSNKPPIYDRIDRLLGPHTRKIELWARPNEHRPEAWAAVGKELNGIDLRTYLGVKP